MRCPYVPSLALAFLLIVIVAGTTNVVAQNNLNIPAGSLIIAMDNERQGSALPYGQTGGTAQCAGPQFNIRAYGYAVRLLQQDVKLLWIINSAKTQNSQDDITGITVSQLPSNPYGGQNCAAFGGGTVNFRGGPLVIAPEYAGVAKSLLISYNQETANVNNQIRVYEVVNTNSMTPVPNADVTELTHKPFVAVGPNCPSGQQNCLPPDVYERLFTAAGLRNGTDFAPVSDDVFDTKCPTLAAQAHALTTAVSYRQAYQDFVADGGNMLLQCRSVVIFEDPASDLFFTRYGIDGITNTSTSTTTTTLNPQLMFNQYVGDLARTNGYTYFNATNGTGADWLGSTIFAAQKSDDSDDKVAFWRDTTAAVGGVVMALGGHEYGGYAGDNINLPGGNDSVATNANYERVNGSRMALNAILVPSMTKCSFDPPKVQGYKTVKLGTGSDDTVPVGVINTQDNVEWTVKYINTGSTAIANFQITDTIDSRLAFVPSLSASVQATPAGPSTSVAVNGSFTGTGANTSMLSTSVPFTLNPGAMITVKVKTKVLVAGDIPNQAVANGNGIPSPIKTDSADKDTPTVVIGYPVAGDCGTAPTCYDQSPWVVDTAPNSGIDDWTAAIEPTYISLSTGTTAAGAELSGRVQDSNGRAVARETITLQSATTGEITTVLTNTFGYFRFVDVQVGDFYVLSIKSRRYTYEVPTLSFSLEDSIAGIQFTASRSGVTSSSPAAPKAAAQDSTTPPAAAKAVPAQRRTIVLSPVKKKALKDDEESDKDL